MGRNAFFDQSSCCEVFGILKNSVLPSICWNVVSDRSRARRRRAVNCSLLDVEALPARRTQMTLRLTLFTQHPSPRNFADLRPARRLATLSVLPVCCKGAK
jgi:hypothetical protein